MSCWLTRTNLELPWVGAVKHSQRWELPGYVGSGTAVEREKAGCLFSLRLDVRTVVPAGFAFPAASLFLFSFRVSPLEMGAETCRTQEEVARR